MLHSNYQFRLNLMVFYSQAITSRCTTYLNASRESRFYSLQRLSLKPAESGYTVPTMESLVIRIHVATVGAL